MQYKAMQAAGQIPTIALLATSTTSGMAVNAHTGANGGQPDDPTGQKTLRWQYSFWGD
uniref:Uncharacterized protein n=1 Tax=Anguilla anguilla TaxID=7936 RepID=A0A0E9VSP1_ANGAN